MTTQPVTTPELQKRHRRRLFFVIATLISGTVSLVILELGCRLLGFAPVPITIPNTNLHKEQWLREAQLNGWVHPPHQVTLVESGDLQTGIIEIRRNNCGFREDAETPVAKPDGTYRILVLGDSHTDGFCLNSESFSNCLEANLPLPPRIDVINAGQVAFSPYQEWWLYENVGRHFAPDLIVVAIYGGNDYWDLMQTKNRVHLNREGGRFVHHLRPPVDSHVPGQKSLPPTFNRQCKNFLRDHFATYHALAEIGPLRSAFGTPPVYSPFERKVQKLPQEAVAAYFQSLGQAAYYANAPATLPETDAMFKHTVGLFQASASRDRAALLFLVIPTLREVCPEVDSQGIASAVSKLRLSAEQATLDTKIRGLAVQAIRESHAEVIDLYASLIAVHKSHPERRLYHKFDNHLAPEGHRVVADVLAKLIPQYVQTGEASPPGGNTPP